MLLNFQAILSRTSIARMMHATYRNRWTASLALWPVSMRDSSAVHLNLIGASHMTLNYWRSTRPDTVTLGTRNVSSWLLLPDSTYKAKLEASKPYNIKILHPIPGIVGMMIWLMPRSLAYAVLTRSVLWRCLHSCSPVPRHPVMFCRISSLSCHRCPITLKSRSRRFEDEIKHNRLSCKMLNYCAPLHRWRCRTATIAQSRFLKEQ